MAKQYDNTDRGVLFRVEEKKSDKHPDYSGNINVGGVDFFLDAWINESESGRKYMSLKVKLKESKPAVKSARGRDRDDPPF